MLKSELGLDTKLIPGGVGEFTVWIKGTKVAEKDFNGFPSEPEVLEKAKAALTD
jgi:hypothetical protein